MKNPGDIITLIVNDEEKEFVVTERNPSSTIAPCKFCDVRKKIDAVECARLCGGALSEIPADCYLKETI